ncbi:MAG TPA: hypothetical protein V6C64_02845 [Microcoleaceae cyanobacterium]|jgi:chromosome segregation ATPase
MARKRLSDLLREEAGKPTADAKAVTPEATESPALEQNQDSEPAIDVEAVPVNEGQPELETLVAELKTAVEQAEQREAELKQQVHDLKAELKTQAIDLKQAKSQLETAERHNDQLETEMNAQAAEIKQLQSSLKTTEQKAKQLDAELTEAKQAALQLAEANSKLTQALEASKQSAKPAAKLAAQPAAKPAAQPVARPVSPATQPAPLTPADSFRQLQERSLAHPIFPNKVPGQLTEQDLGWVD